MLLRRGIFGACGRCGSGSSDWGQLLDFNILASQNFFFSSKIDSRTENCSKEPMKNPPQSTVSQSGLTCIEICSGAGGQAIGLERAGFEALAHVEFDRHACETLRLNRPDWNVVEGDVRDFSAKEFKGVKIPLNPNKIGRVDDPLTEVVLFLRPSSGSKPG